MSDVPSASDPVASAFPGLRVDVDREREPVLVPGQVWHELCAHAREAAAPPGQEECCGLLLGTPGERYARVHRCRNVASERPEHPRDARTGFVMDESDYLRAQREADANGERITAVYHSHVGYAAYLSELDLECLMQPGFPFPDADQIVVSVIDGRVGDIAVFHREAASPEFEGRLLAPVGPA